MGYTGKVFKAGNSAAVRLPKDVAFALGTEITIAREGDTVTIKPLRDADEQRRRNAEMVDRIRAIWDAAGGPPEPEKRDPDIFPDRPGLY